MADKDAPSSEPHENARLNNTNSPNSTEAKERLDSEPKRMLEFLQGLDLEARRRLAAETMQRMNIIIRILTVLRQGYVLMLLKSMRNHALASPSDNSVLARLIAWIYCLRISCTPHGGLSIRTIEADYSADQGGASPQEVALINAGRPIDLRPQPQAPQGFSIDSYRDMDDTIPGFLRWLKDFTISFDGTGVWVTYRDIEWEEASCREIEQEYFSQPGPVCGAAIAALPRVPVDVSMLSESGKAECVICREEVEETEVTMLPCKHWFDFECIKLWLRKHSNSCPCCRRLISRTGAGGKSGQEYIDYINEMLLTNWGNGD